MEKKNPLKENSFELSIARPSPRSSLIYSKTPFKSKSLENRNFFGKLIAKCKAFLQCPKKVQRKIDVIVWQTEEREDSLFDQDYFSLNDLSSIRNQSRNTLFTSVKKKGIRSYYTSFECENPPKETQMNSQNRNDASNFSHRTNKWKLADINIDLESLLANEEESQFMCKTSVSKGLDKIIEEITEDQEDTMDQKASYISSNEEIQNKEKNPDLIQNIVIQRNSNGKQSPSIQYPNPNSVCNENGKVSKSSKGTVLSNRMSILNENTFKCSKSKSDSFVGKAMKLLPHEYKENNPFLLLNQEKFVFSEYARDDISNREMDIESRSKPHHQPFHSEFLECNNFFFQNQNQNPIPSIYDKPFISELSPILPTSKYHPEPSKKNVKRKEKIRCK